MEITSEIIMALGMIVLAVIFSLVSSQIIGSQQSGIFSSTQTEMASEIAANVEKAAKFDGSTQISYQPPLELYRLDISGERIELSVEGENTREIRISSGKLSPNRVEDAEEICIRKESEIYIEEGECKSIETSEICAEGGCNQNQCLPEQGEDCSNRGCSCGDQGSPASDKCAYDYDPSYDPDYISGGEPVVDLSCINEDYVDAQDEGERCQYDFECTAGSSCSTLHEDADSSAENHCCPSGERWDGNSCKEKKDKFKLAFVPLNRNTDAYDSAVNTQSGFFIDNYPFNSCRDQVEIVKIDEVCSVPVSPSSCSDEDRLNTVKQIEECVENSGHTDYDKAAGIFQEFQENICGGTTGWSYGPDNFDAVVSMAGSKEVVAHEIGHEYGLNDEYLDICRYPGAGPLIDANSNCLQETYNGDRGFDTAGDRNDAFDPGNSQGIEDLVSNDAAFCAGGSARPQDVDLSSWPYIGGTYTIWCEGNQNSAGGRDIMSYAGAPEPRGFAAPAQNHLQSKEKLSCD